MALSPAWWPRLSGRWLDWRDRLLASPAFRRRAAAFALTRPTARRDARALFDLVAGFVYSQVLAAAVRLDLFEILAEGPQDLDRLARRLGLPRDGADRLLGAAVALRLVERRADGRFGLGRLGAPLVGNRAVVAMIEHHRALYADLADPVALLRGGAKPGALARYWPYAADGAGRVDGGDLRRGEADGAAGADDGRDGAAALRDAQIAPYTALMAASQPLVADEVLDAYPLRRHRRLLDVGGGDGTFVAAAAGRAPQLHLTLFDLPAVAARARKRLAANGLGDRTDAVGGSFLVDPLPRGADIATLIRVVHDHDDRAAATLLRAVHAALEPGGTLLVAEPMAGTPGAEAMGDAYFGFYLLAMSGGRPRTEAVLTGMLHDAGFARVEARPTNLPLQTRLLVARKSA